MIARLLTISLCFLGATALAARSNTPEVLPARQPLSALPLSLDQWQGRNLPRFTEDIERVLGADEYLNRFYVTSAGSEVNLYAGYYYSQRAGDAIHSPLNCLPGAGWLPVVQDQATIAVPGRAEPITVNQFVIQKGLDRQLVLYWYQSHGRVIANEYWSKFYLVYDAARLNRSDAAMVRVISFIRPTPDGEAVAIQQATEFVRALFPKLPAYLPS